MTYITYVLIWIQNVTPDDFATTMHAVNDSEQQQAFLVAVLVETQSKPHL